MNKNVNKRVRKQNESKALKADKTEIYTMTNLARVMKNAGLLPVPLSVRHHRYNADPLKAFKELTKREKVFFNSLKCLKFLTADAVDATKQRINCEQGVLEYYVVFIETRKVYIMGVYDDLGDMVVKMTEEFAKEEATEKPSKSEAEPL